MSNLRSGRATSNGWELVSHDSSAAVFGSFPLGKLPCRIGRGNGNDVRLPNATVSTHHALIQPLDDGLAVGDLGSRNGTFVNGRRINCCFPIVAGDLLQFGNMLLELKIAQYERNDVTCVAGNNEDLALALSRFGDLFDENMLRPHFQPIVAASGRTTVAYEVLSRSTIFGLTLPKTMFEAAELFNRSSELSRFMREIALIQPRVTSEHLFLNTHPSELEDLPQLVLSLRRLRELHPSVRITVEIHESAVADIAALKEIRVVLSELQMGLAYDDFGAGQARLAELIEASPDVLKFDMKMVHGIDMAPKPKQQMVESLVRMTRDLGIAPLAEGIETDEEAEVCQQMGFELFQGFLFGPPVPRKTSSPAISGAGRLSE
jgi:EAL domain-containing protein (putative c-di-GMP-specific phosphodiesterase class I)